MPWMTIPIALAITGAGTAGAQIYATKKTAGQNKQAIQASEQSDIRADTRERERLAEERRALDAQLAEAQRRQEEELKLAREDQARKERLYAEAVQRDRERWQDYLRINEPHWRQGAGVLGSLYDIAGVGSAPAYVPPAQPPKSMSGGPRGGGRAEMSLAMPPVSGGDIPGQGGAPAGDVLQRQPQSRYARPAMSMMPTPSSNPVSSLSDLMQLTTLAGPSRLPARQMDLSRLMTMTPPGLSAGMR